MEHCLDQAITPRKSSILRGTLIALPLLIAGCGSDKPVTLAITPASAEIEAGDSVELIVSAENTRFILQNPVPGTVALQGNRIIYTPPAIPGRYEVSIVATKDSTKAATSAIDVFVPPDPEITSFSLEGISPGTIDQETGTILFTEYRWIDNLEALTAAFSAVGEVTVDGTPQTSGLSTNNFYRDVQYKVATGKFRHRTYTVRVNAPQTTGLPIIRIETEGNQPITSKEEYIQTDIQVIDVDNPEFSFSHTGYQDQVRGRGNSTWLMAKKPYRIKFDKKTSMFGLPAAKSWILLANYQDPTLMLNCVTFELGHLLSLPFTHHCIPVEVFVNGEYQGNFTLTEHKQVGKGRVEIDEDHGFFIEIDTYFDEEPKFRTTHYDLPVMIKSPEDLEDPSGYDFVKDALHVLETAMIGPSFPDSGYRNLIDMETLIDFLLVNDFVMNQELIWPKSVYLYKDAGGKISFGPLWDFDWAYGYAGGGGHQYFATVTGLLPKHPFFERFYQDPVFVARYKERWHLMREQIAGLINFIQNLGTRLERSQEMNFWRWPGVQTRGHVTEVEELRLWWEERVSTFDAAISSLH
jgi:hypothetical protein